MADNGVKTTNRKAVYCCCCCTFMYFIFSCINVFMFKKNYLYVYKKRDIYKYEFYLCNILKMDANAGQFCFFFLLSQIVVNVFKNDKKNIPCALTCMLSGFYVSVILVNPNNWTLFSFRVMNQYFNISVWKDFISRKSYRCIETNRATCNIKNTKRRNVLCK